jgi:hypothetical protein
LVVSDLPDDVRALGDALAAGLDDSLGPRFVGMFQYGAACFPPSPVGDFDAHVIVDGPFDEEDRRRVTEMLEGLRGLPLGDEMDVWYITLDAARCAEPPRTELKPDLEDDSWALHRAHVHAGRFVSSRGPDPREIVPVPTWPEIDEALQGELEYVEEHLDVGPAYCVLNLCRLLYSYEMRDPVTSKLHAALWAHACLDAEQHPLIRQAMEAYLTDDQRTFAPVSAFHERMAEKIERARAQVGGKG